MYTIEEFDKQKTKVLKYILYQKRTEQEIRKKFSHTIDQNMLEDIIEYLKETKYIDDKEYSITCISMGNPHAVVFWNNLDNLDIEKIGPAFEYSPLFPERVNVEFVQIINSTTLKMRVWERGAGETLACGTGACGTVVAGNLNGLTNRHVYVELLGGELEIEWNKDNNHVYMTGPAVTVFEGEI